MKPGSVKGPVRVKPNKKSDLTDYRRAKRVQDHLNWQFSRLPTEAEILHDIAMTGEHWTYLGPKK